MAQRKNEATPHTLWEIVTEDDNGHRTVHRVTAITAEEAEKSLGDLSEDNRRPKVIDRRAV